MRKVRGYLFSEKNWPYEHDRYDDEYNESHISDHRIHVRLPNDNNYESLSGECVTVVPAKNKEENK